MTVSANVDKYWQELNKGACARNKLTRSVQTSSDPSGSPNSRSRAASTDQPSDQLQQLQIRSHPCPAGVHLAYEDLQSFLQRDLQALKAPAAAQQRQALQNLQVLLVSNSCWCHC